MKTLIFGLYAVREKGKRDVVRGPRSVLLGDINRHILSVLGAIIVSMCLLVESYAQSDRVDMAGGSNTESSTANLYKPLVLFNINRAGRNELPILIGFANRYVDANPEATTVEIRTAVFEVWNEYREVQENAYGGYDLSGQTPALATYSMINILRGTNMG